jgi:hypothetical protein
MLTLGRCQFVSTIYEHQVKVISSEWNNLSWPGTEPRVCCLCDSLTSKLPRTYLSQTTMLSTRAFKCPRPQSVGELCTDWTKAIWLKTKKNLKKNTVSWDVVACSPVVQQCFRVTSILPPATCWLLACLTLKKQAVCSSRKSLNFSQITWHHILENSGFS